MAVSTLEHSVVRILGVDDYPAWCSKYETSSKDQPGEIVGEAWDGPDGVWKARRGALPNADNCA